MSRTKFPQFPKRLFVTSHDRWISALAPHTPLIVWSDQPDEKGVLAARTRLTGQRAAYAPIYVNPRFVNRDSLGAIKACGSKLEGPPLLSLKSYLRTISQLRPGSDALLSALAG